MKLRNYENKFAVLFLVIIFFLFLFLLCLFSYFYRVTNYVLINGVVFKDDIIEIMVLEDEKNIIYSNGSMYIDGNKYSYEIINVIDSALVKNDNKYSIMYLKCLVNDFSENSVVNLVFIKDRGRLYEFLKLIWGSD